MVTDYVNSIETVVKVKGEHNHEVVIQRKKAPRVRRGMPKIKSELGDFYDDGTEYIIDEDMSVKY